MNTRMMRTGFTRYSLSVAAGLSLMLWTTLAAAQTISGGSVSGTAGEVARVPIMLDTGSDNVAFFAVTFTVVAQDGAPAITTAMTYQAASGVPSPDLNAGVPAQGKLAIGYQGVTISPPLSGMLQVGTLMVPIPAEATGGSYEVQLTKISAGNSDNQKVTLTGQNGAITLAGGTPTPTPGPVANSLSAGTVPGSAGQPAEVPITINTGEDNVAFFAVTFTVVAQGGAPAITTAMTYRAASGVPAPDLNAGVPAQGKLAIGYQGVTISPPLTGTLQVGTLTVPIPAEATGGSYEVQLTKISAGNSDNQKVTLTGQNGAITLGGTPPSTSTPTPQGVATDTPTTAPTNTPTTAPTNTPTTAPTNTPTGPPTATPTATATSKPGTATATPVPTTVLTKSVGASDTCIPVANTSIFSASGGYAYIGSEFIHYGGIGTSCPGSASAVGAAAVTSGALIDVTRNLNGQGSSHDQGTTVAPAAAPAPSCPSCEDDDGCQIGVAGQGSAWLLLIPAMALLAVRRRRR
jgi:MYXO-CTERM domain-containing protein